MVHIETTFLGSKFGRRMFLLFVGCALLPILVLAVVSYSSVNKTLQNQGESRLRDYSKSAVMGIWERLTFLDTELQIIASELRVTPVPHFPRLSDLLGQDLAKRFRSVVVVSDSAGTFVLHGSPIVVPIIEPDEWVHMNTQKPLLKIETGADSGGRYLLVRRAETVEGEVVVLWGEVEPLYLWWGPTFESTLPPMTELQVLDASKRSELFSSLPAGSGTPTAVLNEVAKGSQGNFSWNHEETEFLAHYRVVNLRPVFFYPTMTIVMSEAGEQLLLPLASFRRSFPTILLASFWIILLLSIAQIRKSMTPLQELQSGTRQISEGKFDIHVEVTSNDEFADLADSFNSMATSLNRQFNVLGSLNSLQQAILSELDPERIVATVLEQFDHVLPCERVCVSVITSRAGGVGWRYCRGTEIEPTPPSTAIELSVEEMALLERNRKYLVQNLGTYCPSYFSDDSEVAVDTLIAFPVFVQDELTAVVAAAIGDISGLSANDIEQARQLTDQVSIALSNAHLIEELDDLNWGTLTALARTIDVRSHWTMGHTERVTSLAQQLGRAVGLSSERLQVLHRGSLLHDIGKIGVSASILDKPDRLTPEEMDKVREHVQLGVRIIEPIPGLADSVPIVHQHHEWINGKGYPLGLAGNEICLEARILSVADCYDALRSARPYRPALSHETVLEYLHENAGVQFDPLVVEIFTEVVAPRAAGMQPQEDYDDVPVGTGTLPLPIRGVAASGK